MGEKNYTDRSWVELSRENIKYNLSQIKKCLFDNEEIIAVVKANAYGHDTQLFSKELYDLGVRHFAVACLSEAIELRKVISDCTIIILAYTPYNQANELVKYNLCQTITSYEYLDNLYKYSDDLINVHIAIDTGMSRIGLSSKDLNKSFEYIDKAFSLYNVLGMFTHLTSADDDSKEADDITSTQIERFKPFLKRYSDSIKFTHFKNSSAIFRRLDNLSNYARCGIILYGLYPASEMEKYIDLKEVLSWYTVVSSVRDVKKGEAVGYNSLFVAPCDMRVASVACGYSDGYRREMTNKAHVLVNGKIAKQIGRICMDQFMIDVTGIEDVSIGSKVVLIGKDGDLEIKASDLASIANTNHYDILSNISKRVDRKIV